ncbi:endonuclease domain-containing protein [Hoeflea sp.]|uniref:endonuclease domain-containing protein n=1 Tax=Hoeflea sp. TaxID=1940281 RepID=UPI003A90CAA0
MAPTAVDPKMIPRARMLRRTMTEGEKRLWAELRDFKRLYGLHVRKQVPIGPFIADFAIHSAKLVIEVDGEHHFTADGQAKDARRDDWLKNAGYRIVRFNTGELADAFDGCIEQILRELRLMN